MNNLSNLEQPGATATTWTTWTTWATWSNLNNLNNLNNLSNLEQPQQPEQPEKPQQPGTTWTTPITWTTWRNLEQPDTSADIRYSCQWKSLAMELAYKTPVPTKSLKPLTSKGLGPLSLNPTGGLCPWTPLGASAPEPHWGPLPLNPTGGLCPWTPLFNYFRCCKDSFKMLNYNAHLSATLHQSLHSLQILIPLSSDKTILIFWFLNFTWSSCCLFADLLT